MPIEEKYKVKGSTYFRDVRPWRERVGDWFSETDHVLMVYAGLAFPLFLSAIAPVAPHFQALWDIDLVLGLYYLRWLGKREFKLPFKMPKHAAPMPDPRNNSPSEKKKSNGILFLGNDRIKKDEVWLTDSDARTHILFLGTTGAGKTEGLKALAANALTWASGFVFVDGKADTSTWGAFYALVRRFGREDDILVVNYMTGNSDTASTSNTMNPFAIGSASYLVQMLVSLLAEGGGDNAMWKDRAISLVSALMPALTYRRDNRNQLLDIDVISSHLELEQIIAVSRDTTLPQRILLGIKNYLKTLPGYVDEAFDDDGKEKPPSPDAPVYDLSTARQQHGYLSMQFTRSLQSLSGDYSYIFKAQLADIDVIDVVLNRRILYVMIPALEKSGDEAANLGKIVVSALKGMMGTTLGATVDGSWELAIENKATNAPSPYMAIFDEVGYYTAPGMAVMAAQGRSLGFSLVFAAQDLPAMEKRVKEEAKSIAGNCNLKIFGKLEDPTGTREFFERSVGKDSVMQVKGMKGVSGSLTNKFAEDSSVSIESKDRANYDKLKEQREGQVTMLFSEHIVEAQMPYIDPGKPRALRIQKLLPVPGVTPLSETRDKLAADIAGRLNDSGFSAGRSGAEATLPPQLDAAIGAFRAAGGKRSPLEAGIAAIVAVPATNDAAAVLAATAVAASGTPRARLGQGNSQGNAPGDSAQATQTGGPPTPIAAPPAPPAVAERDLNRVQVKPATTLPPFQLPPFQLPSKDAGMDAQLREMAGKISERLVGA